jgi:hypothetical protein
MKARIFSVYGKKDHPDDIVVLKDGFCLEAYLFGALWALYKRLWILGITSGLMLIGSSMVDGLYFELLSNFVEQLILLMYGFFAYDILEYKLNQTGYQLKDIVLAYSSEEAELMYLRRVNK